MLIFGKKRRSPSFSAGSATLISKNTEIIGDIVFSDTLMIEGKVRGNIYGTDTAHVHVLEKGVVEGEIRVSTMVINGTINGDAHSDNHIELAAKAVVTGNVHYALIEVVKGAQVNGSLVFAGKTPTNSGTPKITESHADKKLPATDLEKTES